MKEVTLTDGTIVRCRPVPPHVYSDVFVSMERPKYPMVSLQSADGHTEERPALGGTPELDDFQTTLAEWNRKMTTALRDFEMNYGIIEWMRPGSDTWEQDPPEGWRIPSIMAKYGVDVATKDPLVLRVEYIKHELILGDNDVATLDSVLTVEPVTKKGVEAATVPLSSNTE